MSANINSKPYYLFPSTSLVKFQRTWPFVRFFVPTPRDTVDPEHYYDDDIAIISPPDVRIDFHGRAPLTRPSTPNNGTESIVQMQSRLMALSIELRLQIWEEVLGGQAFHLSHWDGDMGVHKGRLTGRLCESPDPKSCRIAGGRCGKPFLPDVQRQNWLSLLQTCRQIYAEAIDVLYSSNRFIITDSEVLQFLPSTMLEQRINKIKTLRFSWRRWPEYIRYGLGPLDIRPLGPIAGRDLALARREAQWSLTWLNISRMQQLQNLDVRFFLPASFWSRLSVEDAEKLFTPIRGVTALDVFTVTVVWPPVAGEDPGMYFPGDDIDKSWSNGAWTGLPCVFLKVPSYREL